MMIGPELKCDKSHFDRLGLPAYRGAHG